VLIEQAVFTSAQDDHAVGYHLVGRSPGVEEPDARELTVWGPSHDSLAAPAGSEPVSVNFFRLPSGAYCISKTQLAGGEYSGRGNRTYTNCLLVPSQLLARFAANPFRILRAVAAKGLLRVYERVPVQLAPFQLPGRAPPVDDALVAQFVERYPHEAIIEAIDLLVHGEPIFVVANQPPEPIVAALVNLLPASCRKEVTFATGLKYSKRRPFQLLFAAEASGELKRQARQGAFRIVEFTAKSAEPVPTHDLGGWAAYVQACIARDRMRDLFAQLVERQEGLHLANLDELGVHLIERLDELVTARFLTPEYTANGAGADRADEQETAETKAAEQVHESGARVNLRADAPSADRFEGNTTSPFAPEPRAQEAGQGRDSGDQAAQSVPAPTENLSGRASHDGRLNDGLLNSPSELLDVHSAETVQLLEKLDDCVFDAISGDQRALTEVVRLWPEVVQAIGPSKIEESREQYLRYALSIWESCLEEGLREPKRAVASLQVLNVLFGD
jgi:GTPase-associated protein 1